MKSRILSWEDRFYASIDANAERVMVGTRNGALNVLGEAHPEEGIQAIYRLPENTLDTDHNFQLLCKSGNNGKLTETHFSPKEFSTKLAGSYLSWDLSGDCETVVVEYQQLAGERLPVSSISGSKNRFELPDDLMELGHGQIYLTPLFFGGRQGITKHHVLGSIQRSIRVEFTSVPQQNRAVVRIDASQLRRPPINLVAVVKRGDSKGESVSVDFERNSIWEREFPKLMHGDSIVVVQKGNQPFSLNCFADNLPIEGGFEFSKLRRPGNIGLDPKATASPQATSPELTLFLKEQGIEEKLDDSDFVRRIEEMPFDLLHSFCHLRAKLNLGVDVTEVSKDCSHFQYRLTGARSYSSSAEELSVFLSESACEIFEQLSLFQIREWLSLAKSEVGERNRSWLCHCFARKWHGLTVQEFSQLAETHDKLKRLSPLIRDFHQSLWNTSQESNLIDKLTTFRGEEVDTDDLETLQELQIDLQAIEDQLHDYLTSVHQRCDRFVKHEFVDQLGHILKKDQLEARLDLLIEFNRQIQIPEDPAIGQLEPPALLAFEVSLLNAERLDTETELSEVLVKVDRVVETVEVKDFDSAGKSEPAHDAESVKSVVTKLRDELDQLCDFPVDGKTLFLELCESNPVEVPNGREPTNRLLTEINEICERRFWPGNKTFVRLISSDDWLWLHRFPLRKSLTEILTNKFAETSELVRTSGVPEDFEIDSIHGETVSLKDWSRIGKQVAALFDNEQQSREEWQCYQSTIDETCRQELRDVGIDIWPSKMKWNQEARMVLDVSKQAKTELQQKISLQSHASRSLEVVYEAFDSQASQDAGLTESEPMPQFNGLACKLPIDELNSCVEKARELQRLKARELSLRDGLDAEVSRKFSSLIDKDPDSDSDRKFEEFLKKRIVALVSHSEEDEVSAYCSFIDSLFDVHTLFKQWFCLDATVSSFRLLRLLPETLLADQFDDDPPEALKIEHTQAIRELKKLVLISDTEYGYLEIERHWDVVEQVKLIKNLLGDQPRSFWSYLNRELSGVTKYYAGESKRSGQLNSETKLPATVPELVAFLEEELG